MNISLLLEQLIAKEDLAPLQMREIMLSLMKGELTDAQLGAFLVLMRAKGESVSELTEATQVCRELAHSVSLGDNLIDIVGTGGDGRNTFNISTVSSFVAAAAGARVAKHGNRAVSSRSGSADFLSLAGFNLELDEKQLQHCMNECAMSFLFAPHFHVALSHAKKVRQALQIRTLFNLIGPLINPAQVTKQVVGVFNHHWQKPLAHVLANLGSEHALVIHSQDGMDEVSLCALTDVVEYHQGHFNTWQIDPKNYGFHYTNLDDVTVSSPEESLNLAMKVLHNQSGAPKDIVILNTALALYCGDIAQTFEEGLEKATQAIESKAALEKFEQLKQLTNEEK